MGCDTKFVVPVAVPISPDTILVSDPYSCPFLWDHRLGKPRLVPCALPITEQEPRVAKLLLNVRIVQQRDQRFDRGALQP